MGGGLIALIAVFVLYFLVLCFALGELVFSFLLARQGKIQLSFRLGFFLLVVLHCIIRLSVLLCSFLIQDAELSLRVLTFLFEIGNTTYVACFLQVLLVFTQALKMQMRTTIRVTQYVAYTLFAVSLIFELAVLITFEVRLDTELRDGDSLQMALAEVYYILKLSLEGHLVITFLLALAFMIMGGLLYSYLRAGAQASGPQPHSDGSFHLKMSLTTKILSLTSVVVLSLLAKSAYVIYLTATDQSALGVFRFVFEFFSEVIPLILFQVTLYLSRKQVASSRGPESGGVSGASGGNTARNQANHGTELDANEWIRQINNNSAQDPLALRGSQKVTFDQDPDVVQVLEAPVHPIN